MDRPLADSNEASVAMTSRAPGLMVCGTTSNAGKTTLVAGLCRVLARRGLDVAPFKAQNMALNSAVTSGNHEIGRAQYLQAQAAGVEPEVAMNPILLKPTGDVSSQVVIEGRPRADMSAAEYHEAKPDLLRLVMRSLDDLRSRFDVVVLEGAGSPAEINLLEHDIVNLRIAADADLPAIIVGDIEPGGVFAALYGTIALLPDELRRTVRGFVINKFRGDPKLLGDGFDQLEKACGLPTFGVLPMLADLGLDAEDSVALAVAPPERPDAGLDVAVVQLPHISNFTDIDPLIAEPDVAVRFVRSSRELGRPDLVVLPGSKTTVGDLRWLRERGLADAIRTTEAAVVGICAGYQMLGSTIEDPVESREGTVEGLGLLPVRTVFGAEKVLRRRKATVEGCEVDGYQIHHGRVMPVAGSDSEAWLRFDEEPEGFRRGRVFGTTLHGLFDNDGFRTAFLSRIAAERSASFRPSGESFALGRERALDRLADSIEQNLDLDRIWDAVGLPSRP